MNDEDVRRVGCGGGREWWRQRRSDVPLRGMKTSELSGSKCGTFCLKMRHFSPQTPALSITGFCSVFSACATDGSASPSCRGKCVEGGGGNVRSWRQVPVLFPRSSVGSAFRSSGLWEGGCGVSGHYCSTPFMESAMRLRS